MEVISCPSIPSQILYPSAPARGHWTAVQTLVLCRLGRAFGHEWPDHVIVTSAGECSPSETEVAMRAYEARMDAAGPPAVAPSAAHVSGTGRLTWEVDARGTALLRIWRPLTMGAEEGGRIVVAEARLLLCHGRYIPGDGLPSEIEVEIDFEASLAEDRHLLTLGLAVQAVITWPARPPIESIAGRELDGVVLIPADEPDEPDDFDDFDESPQTEIVSQRGLPAGWRIYPLGVYEGSRIYRLSPPDGWDIPSLPPTFSSPALAGDWARQQHSSPIRPSSSCHQESECIKPSHSPIRYREGGGSLPEGWGIDLYPVVGGLDYRISSPLAAEGEEMSYPSYAAAYAAAMETYEAGPPAVSLDTDERLVGWRYTLTGSGRFPPESWHSYQPDPALAWRLAEPYDTEIVRDGAYWWCQGVRCDSYADAVLASHTSHPPVDSVVSYSSRTGLHYAGGLEHASYAAGVAWLAAKEAGWEVGVEGDGRWYAAHGRRELRMTHPSCSGCVRAIAAWAS